MLGVVIASLSNITVMEVVSGEGGIGLPQSRSAMNMNITVTAKTNPQCSARSIPLQGTATAGIQVPLRWVSYH